MNLHEETRNGYLISKQMKKVWSIQLEMLEYILALCKKHNLKIWAEGGTLLGAIRHKGFIPWDDDIDLTMLREDYNKLLEIAPNEIKSPYFLQFSDSESGYGRGHAQFRKDGTAAIRPGDLWQNFHQGIFIDIFVYENIPENESDRKETFSQIEHMRHNLYQYTYGSLLSRGVIDYLRARHEIKKAGGYRNYFNSMVALVTECPRKSKNLIADPLFTTINYHRYTRNIEWYRETLWVDFEDTKIPIPFGYDKILKTQYGEYLTPAKAPSMHGTVILDTERSYKELLLDLRHKASLKQKLQHFFSFKLIKD